MLFVKASLDGQLSIRDPTVDDKRNFLFQALNVYRVFKTFIIRAWTEIWALVFELENSFGEMISIKIWIWFKIDQFLSIVEFYYRSQD